MANIFKKKVSEKARTGARKTSEKLAHGRRWGRRWGRRGNRRASAGTDRPTLRDRLHSRDGPERGVRPSRHDHRPTNGGRPERGDRPAPGSRAPLERNRTMETRDPNGSPRRRPGETQHEVDYSVHSDAETRHNGTSYGWLWALPLAALAGLGLYYLAGDRGERTVTAGREAVQPAHDTVATAPDLKGPTLNAIQSLTTAMQGVRDATSATAAVPKLQEASSDDGAACDAGLPAARQHPRGAGRRHTRSDGEAQHADRQRLGAAGRRAAAAAGGRDPARPNGRHRHGAGQTAVPHRRAGRMGAHQRRPGPRRAEPRRRAAGHGRGLLHRPGREDRGVAGKRGPAARHRRSADRPVLHRRSAGAQGRRLASGGRHHARTTCSAPSRSRPAACQPATRAPGHRTRRRVARPMAYAWAIGDELG